jgi:regulator of sigma E protease
MLFYLISFILLLGPLVFVHELGHYLFAKLFNVRVDIFSMGFGPKIFKRKYGETEYCLSVVPLGGYVKLFGQDPTEEVTAENRHRSLNSQDAWKRFLIFVGGPLFNFLFAIFVFSILLVVGEPHVASVIERVVPGSKAAQSGFAAGDLVTAVSGRVITKFEELHEAIAESPGKELEFRVKRAGELLVLKATPDVEAGHNVYGEAVDVGEINGLGALGRHPVVGVSDPNSLAGKLGIRTGDEVVSVNGKPVRSFEAFEAEVSRAIASKNNTIMLGYSPRPAGYWDPANKPKPAQKAEKTVEISAAAPAMLGLHSSELFVHSVIPDSPSYKAGISKGDRLVSVDGAQLASFSQLRIFVQKGGETNGKINVEVERDGKMLTFPMVPTVSEGPARADGEQKSQYMIGVYPLFVQSEPTVFVERIFNPFSLAVQSWSRALDLSGKTLVSIKKLIFRQVSMGALGGPILIGKLAGDSMQRGVASFLKVMALISISLAIFNLLPVPILDGGHIFLLLIEVFRGKPISLRQSEVVQQIGLTLIVFLLVVVLLNDFSRVGLPALRQIFQ